MTINETNTTETGNGQAIGTAVIVSGSVQVESPDGATRALQVNGVVFANETIITGGTGKVSIVFNDSAHSQLDLGRMSEVVLDGDVVPGEQGVDLSDVASEVAQLQEALLQGDPTQDLPAPAAGPVAAGAGARGGGHPTVVFDLTGEEVTPTSGAETIGVARSFLDPERLTGEIDEVVEAPVVEPLAVGITPPGDDIEEPPNTIPLAGDYSSVIDEANFLDGSEPVSTPLTVSGGLATLGIDFGGDGPGSISIGGQSIDMDNLGGSADTSITVAGDYGSLQLWDDGSWTYTITTNIDHPLTDTTGAGDSLPDLFAFTVFDSNGDSATGTLTINILDDGPVASDIVLTRVVEEEALDNSLSVGNPDENDGPEDSDFNSTYQNDAAQVNGSLAPLVTMGADNPGTFSWGSLLDLPGLSSQGGQVVYEMNANGTTLEAWVHDGMPARISSDFEGGESDRLVFTLDLQPDGSYVFTLLDQLDHVSGDGENTALLLWGEGGESVTSLDFATAIIATDSDDDTTGLTPGALSFLIVDDVPELSAMEEPLTVYEDGLDTAAGDESDGIGGGVTDVTINLASLVADGADEHVTYTLLDNLSYQPTGLTSDGKQVSYSVTGNVLTAATVDNTVFTFTLDPFTGNATFDLIDQLDHTGAGDDEMLSINDLGQFVQVEDADGDVKDFSGLLSIQVENDVPELSAMEEPLTVYEDGLDTAAGDESDGIGGGVTDVTINLASLVADGADEDVTYTLLDNLSYQPTGLTSDGKQVSYSVTGNVLTAATVDNTVFTFTLDPLTGNAVFDLIDQLDHTGAGDDEMLSINDLGQFVQVEDADGDVKDFSGLLSIQVENDVPQLVPIIATMAVQEDALGHDYPDVDNAENNVDADFALGNIDETGDTDQASYDLSALVETGADEELRWSLINPYDEGGEASYASQYTSQGQTVYYHLVEGTIIATTSSTAPVSLDVENIFTFSVDEVTGEATFNLNDQLNHPDGSGDEANLTIDDLGQFVRATDSDGDSVDLDDKIHIDVENDVPETAVTGVQYFVSEYAGYDNIIGTYELDENGNPINPGILIGSTNEAAGAGMGENEHSVGEWVEGTKVFLIADGGNQLGDLTNATLGFAETGATDGSPAYVLTIDGIPSAVPVYYMDVALNADGQEHFKDENGNFLNEVPAEGGEIRIEDLSLGDADYDDTVLRVETGLVVDEANLPNGTDPNSALLTVHGNILTGEGMLQIMPGADEPGTLTVTSQIINPENTGAVIPGSEQTIFLDGDHSQSITVSSEAGTLVVYGDGEWEYTLTNNTLMHPDNDPGGHDNSDGDSDRGAQDQVQDIFNLIYEDTDGDTVTPQIIININDDGPEIGEPQFAILANEAGTSLVADLAIDFGADEAGTMNLNPHMDNIGEENTVLDNNGEVMTYQGHALHWLQNPDGSWSAVADMKHEDDEHEDDYGDRSSTTETQNPLPIFTVALEEDSGGVYTGNYTVILHEELDGGQSNEEFSLDFTKGGGHSTNREFVRGDVRINITAEDPDGADPGNVNWSGQGMGVGNAFINEDTDKVQGEDVPLGSEVLIFNFTGTETGEVFLLNSATFGLDHLDHYDQGADDDIPEVAIWTAYGYEADGVTETVVGTGEVTGQLQGSTWKSDQELTIDENNTSGGFYRVEFTAETTNPEGYRVTQLDGSYEESTPQDVTLSFVVDGEDADGDAFDQQTFDVTFDGEGDIVGTDADEVIVGSSDDDVIYGGGGDDMIFGGEGTDEIYGEDGDDTLLGGTEDPPVDPTDPPEEGDDIIFGGDGADTFDTSEEDAGEVQDYEPDPPPVGDDDELADLVPPVIP